MSSDTAIFLKCFGVSVMLPYNPEKLTYTQPTGNETVTTAGAGEINVLKTRKLSTTEIESFFPMYPDLPGVLTKSQFKNPDFYISFIAKIRDNKKPCYVTLLGTRLIERLMTIEDFEFEYRAQSNDVHYRLSLKECRLFPTEVRTLKGGYQHIVPIGSQPDIPLKAQSSSGQAAAAGGKKGVSKSGTATARKPVDKLAINDKVIINGDGIIVLPTPYGTQYKTQMVSVKRGTVGVITYIHTGQPMPPYEVKFQAPDHDRYRSELNYYNLDRAENIKNGVPKPTLKTKTQTLRFPAASLTKKAAGS